MDLSCNNLLPFDFIRFLSGLMSGKEDIHVETSEKMKWLVFSIGQDICWAVSDGKWKLPKHMLLCVAVQQLFCCKQLTKILHRLGQSATYDLGLEMETAMAKVLDEVSDTPNCDRRGQRGFSLWVGQPQQNYNKCSWQQYCQQCLPGVSWYRRSSQWDPESEFFQCWINKNSAAWNLLHQKPSHPCTSLVLEQCFLMDLYSHHLLKMKQFILPR